MFCIHCGKEIPEGAAFCVHCGRPQGEGLAAGVQPQQPAVPETAAHEKPVTAEQNPPTAPSGAPVVPTEEAAAPQAKPAQAELPGSPYAHPAEKPVRKKDNRLPLALGLCAGGAVLAVVLVVVVTQWLLPMLRDGESLPVDVSTGSAPVQTSPAPDAEPTDSPAVVEATPVPEATPEPAMPMEPIAVAAGEAYEYDLDGDGVNERIQLTSEQGEYYENYTLLLNDQPVPIEGAEGFETELWIVDIDAGDRQKELCFSVMQDSYGLGVYAIIGWRDGAPTVLADLKSIPILMGRGAVYRKITQEFPGDGTFTVWADTPVYSDAFGCMYVGVPYVYDGASVAAVETQIYSLRVDSALAPHYAAYTPFKAYSEPGGSLESFTATLGTVYVPDQLALVGGTLYLHVVSEDGAQSGWISEKSDRSAYYEVPPGWG